MDANFVLNEIWNAAKTAGPFGAMLLLFLLYAVNKERVELQKRYDELQKSLLERTINGLHDTSSSLRDLTQMFVRIRGSREHHGSD